ncbi:MAG: CoA ester lyase [Rhizobiales bacterium]|nr:CoA ester lyase [Hyphomicrobiales bacterium]NRB13875.1 CoA ester lyase [Hyphomicrobiales bacterium]
MMLRSLLYVPANIARFIDKAASYGADAIILDLEDSVPTNEKLLARNQLENSIKQVGQSGATVFVRINADIENARKDAIAALQGGAFGLMVAKANEQKIVHLNQCISSSFADKKLNDIKFIALIEDAAAVVNANAIGRQNNMFGMLVGGEDLATSLNAFPSPDMLRFPKQAVHYAAKANGLMSFGLCRTITDYTDLQQIAASAFEAKNLGFDGATCIHPSSINILNENFAPSEQEINWANEVLKKAAEQDGGVTIFENKMVDLPILKRAKQILAQKGHTAPPAHKK